MRSKCALEDVKYIPAILNTGELLTKSEIVNNLRLYVVQGRKAGAWRGKDEAATIIMPHEARARRV